MAKRIWSRTGRPMKKLDYADVPNGTLLALDAKTGKVLWKNEDNIWGTQVAVSAKHKVLLMNYKAVRHNFFEIPSEVGGRLAGFDIETGKLCVMVSRHRAGLVVVARDHILHTLETHMPSAEQPVGRPDVTGRGHAANLKFWETLERDGLVVRSG